MQLKRVLFALVMAALVLTACTLTPQSAADRVVDGVSDEFRTSVEAPDGAIRDLPDAGWVSDDEIGVVLIGSSSCPPVITRMNVVEPDSIRLTVDSRHRGNCTDDASPRTHIFHVPTEVTERPLKIYFGPPSDSEHLLLP